jgi:hypothetical protein
VALWFSSNTPGALPQTRTSSTDQTAKWWIGLYLALALAVPLAYVLVTHHVWEDFLITFRHSKNLVEGRGLVYNPGRRVQGFTSVINVMLPAVFYALSEGSDQAALNLYRAVCLGAFVAGGWLLLRMILRDRGVDRWSPLLFILLYVTECKTVAFTMNGQESAFMVAFLSLGLAADYWGVGRWWPWAAVSWTGLLYTRPDAPVYIAALALAGLVFRVEAGRAVAKGMLKAALVAAVLFLPWFIFAWVYYGQPIPNTVLAKSRLTIQDVYDPAAFITFVLSKYVVVSAWLFQPIYAYLGGWPDLLIDTYGLFCWVVCTMYWMVPSGDRLGRLASLLFTLGALYLSLVQMGSLVAPWYMPSATLFGTVVLSRALPALLGRVRMLGRGVMPCARVLQVGLVAVSVLLLVGQSYEIRIQQREIEDNHRRLIGLYLHDVVKPGEAIYLEPLGYIGYYSDRLMLDWPGLVAPEVVRLRREGATQLTVILKLKPAWLVLRSSEAVAAYQVPEIRNSYTRVRVYDAHAALDKYGYIPGRGYLNIDTTFYVLRRIEPPAPTTSPSAVGH